MRRLFFAVLVLVSCVSLAYAEDDMPMMGGKMPMGMMGSGMMGGGMMGMDMMSMMDEGHMLWNAIDDLGLDDAQKDAVVELKSAFMKEAVRKRAEMQIAAIELKDLLRKDPADMKAVEAALRKMEAAKTDIHLAAIKALEAAKVKLTPAQKKKLKEMMDAGMPCKMCQMMMKKKAGAEAEKKGPEGHESHH